MKKLILGISCLALFSNLVFAGDKPTKEVDTALATCQADSATYLHGALTFYHNMFCLGNVMFAGWVEEVFYRLEKAKLSFEPSTLAADGTVKLVGIVTTKDGKSVTVTANKVVAPDTFTGTYDYYMTITVDSSIVTVVYFSGSKTASKGFAILSNSGFKSGSAATEKRLSYVRWDRTGVTKTTEVLATVIGSASYLSDATKDRAAYFKASLNSTTNAVDIQMVSQEKQRSAGSTSMGCFTMYTTGTMGGTVVIGKTVDAAATTGHSTSFATQDGLTPNWDAVSLADSKTTANGTGGITPPGYSFNYSCYDLLGASAALKPFNGNTLNFAMTLTQANAMFGAN